MNIFDSTIECSKSHYDEWVLKSGVSPEIAKLNILSIEDPVKIAEFLGWKGYQGSAGWICTGIDFKTGEQLPYGQFKPDIPIQFPNEPKPTKYLSCKHGYDAVLLEMPDRDYWQNVASDVSDIPVLTEGVKKAGALLTCEYAGVGLPGVDMGFKDGKLVPNLVPFFTRDRQIIIAFDADIIEKKGVANAVKRLAGQAKRLGAIPLIALWDISLGKGIDDVLVNHGAEKVREIMANAIPYKNWLKSLEKQFSSNKSVGGKRPILPPQSDIAEELAQTYRDQLAWNVDRQEWYRYGAKQAGVWQPVKPEFVTQIVTAHLKVIGCSYTHSFVQAVLGLLRSELADEKWDTRDHLLPFINGVLNLQTMKLEAHSSGYKLTWCLPYAYETNATCEPIKEWLLESCDGNHDRVQMLRAALRAIVLGRSDLEKFIELLGSGGTGKSTFARLAIALVGRENTFSTTLAALEGSPYETSAIQNKRLILINDAERWSKPVPVLKAITGNDFIRTEEKFKQRDSGGMIVKAFVLITANEASTASSDYTSGLGRRKLTIPFMNKVAPNKRRDLLSISTTGISGEFAPYLSGLLNWVLAMPETEMKRFLLQSPEACPSLQKWIAESILENNPIAAWLDSQCVTDRIARTQIGIAEDISISITADGATQTKKLFKNSDNWLYANYAQFCRDTGIQRISAKRFSNLLLDLLQNQLHIQATKGRDRTNGTFIEGIRLRLPSDPENYPITGAKIQDVLDSVLDRVASVEAETLANVGCVGCGGLNQVLSQENIFTDSPEEIENIPLRLPNNPPHPPHPTPEPIPAVTQSVTDLNQSNTLEDEDEWIDIDSPATPKKEGFEAGDKVRYVGAKFAHIYGNKELIVNSIDGGEIDCLLPDGSYTTKFKIHDRDLDSDMRKYGRGN
jgi:putative DNA primase/helicase